jgi:hypothetical protein
MVNRHGNKTWLQINALIIINELIYVDNKLVFTNVFDFFNDLINIIMSRYDSMI